MENTPTSFQSSSESGYFDSSSVSMFESTPNAEHNSTPFTVSRKRKAPFLDCHNMRKLTDLMETYPSPPFSSTLNESLMNDLENCNIQTEESGIEGHKGCDRSAIEKPYDDVKIYRSNEYNKKFRSAPNTPEKQTKGFRDSLKRANTSSYVKNFSQINMQSPLNTEAYSILYPDLPPLEPSKRLSTPQKYKESEKIVAPAKKCLFVASRRELFKKVFSNNIIVANIFSHLSDGDLYRVSMVSQALKDALLLDGRAYDRYRRFLHVHRGSKENYRITPPKSPKKEDDTAEASPGSQNFHYFCDIASKLNKNQSLVKCPRCGEPSVVENSIAQCQDVNNCGYIFCRKCDSFANDPKDFKDKCNNAQLLNVRPRYRLGDLSNSTATSDYATESSSFFSSSSLNLSHSNRYDSSGFFSECEANSPRLRAKRNLSKSFTSAEVKPRALSCNNNNNSMTSHPYKLTRRTSVLPVIPLGGPRKPVELVEPSSPPKVKSYSACSKQSKRNLKRLTR